jgi:hypothetical protein
VPVILFLLVNYIFLPPYGHKKSLSLSLSIYVSAKAISNPSCRVSFQIDLGWEGRGRCPQPPTLFFFRLDYLLSVMVLFSAQHWAVSCWFFFSISDSLKNQEMKVFFSNCFEDLESMGFTLRLGCSKLGAKIGFLFLVRLGLVRGTWRMNMGFFSWIYTFCVVSEVVGNALGWRNYDRLHNLGYLFSKVSAAF